MSQRIITRKEWGAISPDGFRDRPLPISEWWLHHSVTIAPNLVQPFTDDDAAVRTLERIGQSRFGGGISYTFPVTPVGRIYIGHSMHRQGAHTKGHNTVAAAFVLVGDYTTRKPTDAQRDRIAERMVIEHRNGRATRHRLNGGHRDASGSSTACPGDAGHAAIGDINARADRLWAAGYPGTTTAPTTLQRGDSGTYVTALQRLLVAAGIALTVDGTYGPATETAVKEFQKSAGLLVDGIAGPQTQAALTAPTPAPTPSPSQEAPVFFLVQQKGLDPVYKSDGFRRVHIGKTALGAFVKAGAKVTVLDTTDELDAFGPLEATP